MVMLTLNSTYISYLTRMVLASSKRAIFPAAAAAARGFQQLLVPAGAPGDLASPFQFPRTKAHQQLSLMSSLSSSLSGLGINMRSTRSNNKKWHNPNFLSDASVEEKEDWLRGLLASAAASSPASGSNENFGTMVDTEAYLVVLRALASSKLPDAPIRAERWLIFLERNHADEMERVRQQHGEEEDNGVADAAITRVVPTPECYECVIRAWAEARKEDPAILVTRAQRWLSKQLDHPSPQLRPNTACFNAFLDACSRGRAFKGSNRKDLVVSHAILAEKTLRYMMEDRSKHGQKSTIAPNTESFNYVIRAWTRCRKHRNVADRAMGALALLEGYEKSVDPTVGPNSKSYAMVMDAIAVCAKLKVKSILNKRNLWAGPAENGLNEIILLHDILSFMREKSQPANNNNNNNNNMAPNTHAMNTLVAAWSHLSSPIHPHATSEAEKILRQMIAMKDQGIHETAPDSYTYLMVMRAWANSDKPNRGQRVSWWLKQQWRDFDFEGGSSLRPSTASYNLVIRVLSDLGDAPKAEQTLSDLIRLSDEHASNPKPNAESFALVIRAYIALAERGKREALLTASRWLKSLVQKEREDDTVVLSQVELYTSILGAARKCASQYPDVLDVAVETFDMLRDSHHLIHCMHYSRLLQVGLLALSRHENNDVRSAFVKQVVDECCRDGLVSSALLRALANGPIYYDGWTLEESMRTLDLLFPDWPIPHSWTRNVKQSEELLPQRSDMIRTIFNVSRHGMDPYYKRND